MPDIAPSPQFPERAPVMYERSIVPGVGAPGRRGPMLFEEGLATDTDVPNGFLHGMADGYVTPPGQPNHNANVYEKWPEETMAERAHVGSAAWTEAPTLLAGFAAEAMGDHTEPTYVQVIQPGSNRRRISPALVLD